MTKEKNLADLHEWLLESDAGDTKEFLAGKEQRKTLHKHCDHLVKTNLDLILSHETGKQTATLRVALAVGTANTKTAVAGIGTTTATGERRSNNNNNKNGNARYSVHTVPWSFLVVFEPQFNSEVTKT